jgi:hypothetical protein
MVQDHPTRGRSFCEMGSRLLPLSLALGAILADTAGAHGIAALVLLVAIPFALGAVCEAVASRGWARSVLNSGSLVLLVVASAVRQAAPVGGHVAPAAISAVIAAAILYLLPVLFWVLQPVSLRPTQATPS